MDKPKWEEKQIKPFGKLVDLLKKTREGLVEERNRTETELERRKNGRDVAKPVGEGDNPDT